MVKRAIGLCYLIYSAQPPQTEETTQRLSLGSQHSRLFSSAAHLLNNLKNTITLLVVICCTAPCPTH